MKKSFGSICVFSLVLFMCLSCGSTHKIEKQMNKVYLRDQNPRIALNDFLLSGETSGEVLLPLIEEIKQNDSINRREAFPIIEKIIARQLYSLDTAVYKTCWLVIQHSEISDILKYTSFIKAIAERELISKNSYMAFFDRYNVDRGKAQPYGFQLYRLPIGDIIQYPLVSDFQRYWDEIGVDYDLTSAIPDEIVLSHPTIILEESEFAIIGSIYQDPAEKPIPVSEIPLYLNSVYVTSTDSSGYFSIVLSKSSTISKLTCIINGIEYEIGTDFDINRDFYILDCYASDIKEVIH